ncbi:hypothetical protein [Sphingorhabdus sp.]|uniref:hypothetical protein n=1 Tax=Sphingorhabdus sp. TaxID=1902408 RepID=UPI0035940A5B
MAVHHRFAMSQYSQILMAARALALPVYADWLRQLVTIFPLCLMLISPSAMASPDVRISMTGQVISDPVSSSNPKTLQGSIVEFRTQVTYSGREALDSDSLVIVNRVPPALSLVVTEAGPDNSSPFLFIEGDRPSELSCHFHALDDSSDCIEFSSDGGASFDYRPAPDLAGVDPSITHLRFRLRGNMKAALPEPSFFILKYRMRVD